MSALRWDLDDDGDVDFDDFTIFTASYIAYNNHSSADENDEEETQ